VAQRYVAFCHIDAKVAGWKYPDLQTQKKLIGLPSLAFLDAEGNVLVKVPFDARTVQGVLQAGKRAEQYVAWRSAVAAGDVAAKAPFLHLQLEEGQLELAAAVSARQQLAAAGDANLLAAIDTQIVDLRIATELRAVGQAERHTLGKHFLAQLRNGPKPSPRASRGFHYAMLEWAERERDAAAFRDALDDFTRVLAITDAQSPWVEPLLAGYRAKLRELQQADKGK